MTTTTRTAALGVFAATLAAVLAFGITPRSVMAHSTPVPGEAVPDHANNCASATVERN